MVWGQVAGAAIGALGSALGGSDQPQMRKFKPWDIGNTLLGSVDFNRQDKTLSTTLSPEMRAIADSYMSTANRTSPTQGFQDFAFGQVQGMLPGLFGGAMDASMVDPSVYGRYDAQMGGLTGQLAGMNGTAGMLGLQNAMGGGPMGAMAQGMYGQGLGMLGERPQSYNDVAASRLGLLREQAAPFEQRSQDALLQRLQSMGQFGAHTGGNRQIESFGQGLAQADTARQLDAQGFAEQLYGRDLSAALQRNSMGAGLMQAGFGGMLNQGQLGAQFLGLNQSGAGMLGNMFGNQFAGQVGYNDTVNQRAQQRIQNAQGLFGFGTQLDQQDLATQQGAVNNYLGLNDALLGQARFGADLGRIAMGTGSAPAGGGINPLGGFLQGVGGAVANTDWSKMFNSGGTAPMPQSISGAFTPTFSTPTYNGPMPSIYGG